MISLLFFPATKYYNLRKRNKRKSRIVISPKLSPESKSPEYEILGLQFQNASSATMRNVIAFVLIEYDHQDIVENISTYKAHTPNWPLTLSWARVIDGKNYFSCDINQGEIADLNVMRFYSGNSSKGPHIVVASESGFGGESGKPGRVTLKGTKGYSFKIRITADNMFPIEKKFYFDPEKILIRDRKY